MLLLITALYAQNTPFHAIMFSPRTGNARLLGNHLTLVIDLERVTCHSFIQLASLFCSTNAYVIN